MPTPLQALFADVLVPLVAADGGQLQLIDETEKTVRISLTLNCEGCPGQQFTLMNVITPAVRKVLGLDVQVEVVPSLETINRRP